MRDLALVALGGAVGAMLRYAVALVLGARLEGPFPWHTFAVNIIGAFLLGLLMGGALDHGGVGTTGRLLLGTGVLGGFTTFSTLSFESIALFEQGLWVLGAANMFGSAVTGLAAAAAGLAAGRAI